MTDHPHHHRNGNGVQTSASASTTKAPAMQELFRKISHATAVAVGSPWAFVIAVVIIAGWAISGPWFHYSDTWQLIINTGTTIVTFLMVFMIQSTQNRDARAIHLKLDELIRAKHGARNIMVDLENCTDSELAEVEAEFRRIKSKASRAKGEADRLGHEGLEDDLQQIEKHAEEAERTVKDTRDAN
jgi:low affinity Fe/Cu permease